jgi:hypothetical protein
LKPITWPSPQDVARSAAWRVERDRPSQPFVLGGARRAVAAGFRQAHAARLVAVEAAAGLAAEHVALEQDLDAAVRQEAAAAGLDADDGPQVGGVGVEDVERAVESFGIERIGLARESFRHLRRPWLCATPRCCAGTGRGAIPRIP